MHLLQDIEERERRAQEDLDRMRQLRDKEQADGDVMEMRRKNDVGDIQCACDSNSASA
jgi:hypothetical protein